MANHIWEQNTKQWPALGWEEEKPQGEQWLWLSLQAEIPFQPDILAPVSSQDTLVMTPVKVDS